MQIWRKGAFMINLSEDIHSLSDFKRQTGKFTARLKKSGRPAVLTINGRAELVVQDASSYQRLLELAEQAEMLEFLRESRADMEAGRTVPAAQALERLAQKHKLKRKGK
jgi:PHD/YefM family antitoxin component YafN of YafNO toxin-antitoxin module